MRNLRNAPVISISPGFCAVIAAITLIFPVKWVLAWLCAAAVHELGHYIVVKLCGGRIFDIRIGYGGARMETDLSGGAAELISAAAGPILGGCLLFFVRWFPRLAICAFIQTAYNLLPIYGFDGGLVLRRALEYILPQKYIPHVTCITEWLVVICIIALSIIAVLLLDLGLIPLAGAFVLVCRTGFIKIPCKDEKQIVQ